MNYDKLARRAGVVEDIALKAIIVIVVLAVIAVLIGFITAVFITAGPIVGIGVTIIFTVVIGWFSFMALAEWARDKARRHKT